MLGLLSLVLVLHCGCQTKSERAVHPVSGRVVHQGRPVSNALVVFHDTRALEEVKDMPIPRATTGGDGAFQLMSYHPGDGAPVGEYKVTITAPTAVPKEGETRESGGNDADRFGGRYADPETTPFSVEVQEGENKLAPLDLK
jgi:hypothetical protein